MSKIEVNAIEPQCGTTLTIGASDTSIAGIGTVNWDTTAKTAAFTAVSGRGYFVNTTSGAITMTLPATPSSGDIVAFKDYANTFDTNNLTIARNGSPIAGVSADAIISVEGQSGTLIYVDGTKGWMIVNASTDADLPAPAYVTATGGTITTCGDYKIHTFTSPGTFCVSCAGNPIGSDTVDYLVVAGGGGGGQNTPFGTTGAGAGGAGGYRESSGEASGCYTASPLGACVSALPVTAQGYPITVGAGGAGSPCAPGFRQGCSGSNSIFSTITSAGGGGGGSGNTGTCGTADGGPGGSGGGSSCQGSVGSGNTPPVSPPQGNNGGFGTGGTGAGGGGGAGAVGGTSPGVCGASGGNGVTSSINASPVTRAGGGGGGGNPSGGSGGSGGGGNGASSPAPGSTAGNGTANTGGGGGGGSANDCHTGGTGGSGIVIIRYKYQ